MAIQFAMMRAALICLLLSATLGGCGSASANAFKYDADNDIHCLAIYSFAVGQAIEQRAPSRQLASANLMAEWYGAKASQRVGGLSEAAQAMEVEPIFRALRLDPASSVDASNACFERAASDPKFASFARTHGYRK